MKKLMCALLMLSLCMALTAAAEETYCMYGNAESPCDIIWWVNSETRQHCRACRNHVTDKEDMGSYVPLTPWAACTPDESTGECTTCGWDYDRGSNEDDVDNEKFLLEYFIVMGLEAGTAPVEAEVSGAELGIGFAKYYWAKMMEEGYLNSESMLVDTEYTLTLPEGLNYPYAGAAVTPAVEVKASEYGPGAWLEKHGLLTIGEPVFVNNTAPGTGSVSVEIAVKNGNTYTLTKNFTIEGEAAECEHEETCWQLVAGDHHIMQCIDCKEYLGEPESCQRLCTAPTICIVCVKEGEYRENLIQHDLKYTDHGEYHTSACIACGDSFAGTYHYALCTGDTSRCAECGAEGSIPVNHPLNRVEGWTDNGVSHTGLCGACGNEFTDDHHFSLDQNAVLPAGMHQNKCFCGKVIEETCYVSCVEQSVCYACGGPVENVTWENRYCVGTLEWMGYDNEAHTYSCDACGETYTEPHYLNEQGICTWECGYQQETERTPGDADNDGEIGVADAMAILDRLTGGSVSINEINADVNDDGKVDAQDVLLILQYTAGWDVELK